jgi:Rps23 Pro-64 3,4-dihydroxylase Tpa1-like proline 4-hydroxylase
MDLESDSIKPTYIDAGSVAVYENFWDLNKEDLTSFVDELSDNLSGLSFIPSQVGADRESDNPYTQQSVRTSYEMSLTRFATTNKSVKKINDKCISFIGSAIKNYKEIFNIEQDIVIGEPHILLRYLEGNKFNQHYDGGTQTKRCVSALVYLNDNYEGGELEFTNFGLKIKPKAGSLILFPSNYAYAHIAHPVTSGTKYVITTWGHDR